MNAENRTLNTRHPEHLADPMNNRGLIHSLMRATGLAVGFGSIWSIAAGWGIASLEEVLRPGTVQESIVVRHDGVPLISQYHPDGFPESMTYLDIHRQPIQSRTSNAFQPRDIWTYSGRPGGRNSLFWELSWPERVKSFSTYRKGDPTWFFIHDGQWDGHGCFVQVRPFDHTPVGYLGLDGFSEKPIPRDRQIPVHGALMSSTVNQGNWTSISNTVYSLRSANIGRVPNMTPFWYVYVPSGDSLLFIDLRKQTIRKILQADEPILSMGFPILRDEGQGQVTRQWIVARTAGKFYSLNIKHQLEQAIQIPAELSDYFSSWYRLDDGRFLVTAMQSNGTVVPEIYHLSQAGKILSREHIDLRERANSMSMTGWMMALIFPAPCVIASGTAIIGVVASLDGDALPEEEIRIILFSGSFLVLTLLLFALVCITWRRTAKDGLARRERIAWSLFVFVFGLPGYVGYRLHRTWAPREACPTCGTRTPRDREACCACGAEFPLPELRGNEVFG